MTVSLSLLAGAGWQFFDDNGNPLSGGLLYTYEAGTTTPQTTYTDSNGNVANSNPIVLDAAGRVPYQVWLTAQASYKFILKTSTGVTVWSEDDVEADLDAAALAASNGSSLIGFLQAGTGAVARTVQSKLRDVVSVLDFGADPTGVADSATAIQAALNSGAKYVFAPTPTNFYLLTSKITVPTDVTLSGDNWRTTKLKLGANVDMVELNDGAGLENIWLDGNGASFTGRGVVISSTNGKQTLRNVRVRDTQNACIDFSGPSAGSQFSAVNLDLYRYNSGTGTGRYAVTISATQQLSATPRKFVAVETNGGCAFDFGGCNNTYITASFLADLNYTVDSRCVLITSSRIANQAALTIRGNNNVIVGCDINPAITIASGSDNIALQGNSYNNLPVVDNSGNGRNLIDYWYSTYTPALTSGGTQPTLGNGSISGNFTRSGASVTIQGELSIGSTTSLGTGGLSISLPFTYRNAGIFTGGTVAINRGGTIYEGFLQIAGGGSTTAELLRDTTGSITFNSPAVFASGDTIRWSATYNQ